MNSVGFRAHTIIMFNQMGIESKLGSTDLWNYPG